MAFEEISFSPCVHGVATNVVTRTDAFGKSIVPFCSVKKCCWGRKFIAVHLSSTVFLWFLEGRLLLNWRMHVWTQYMTPPIFKTCRQNRGSTGRSALDLMFQLFSLASDIQYLYDDNLMLLTLKKEIMKWYYFEGKWNEYKDAGKILFYFWNSIQKN